MIVPGIGPVGGASEGAAEANMRIFIAEVRAAADREREVRQTGEVGEPVRDTTLDEGGRFGWVIPIGDHMVPVLMPGVDLAELRSLSVDASLLKVGGEWSWWSGASGAAVPLAPLR